MSGVALSEYQALWNVGAGWVDITSSVISLTDAGELTGNRDNALAFGDSSNTSATVVLSDALAGAAWQRAPIRIVYTMNGVTVASFAGIMTERARESQAGQITLSCLGFAELIKTTKAYSDLFRQRPVATKTTSTSQEDPAVGGYQVGLINYILWTAGGRPVEQNFNSTYIAAAKFWYSCDQALIAPYWSWTAGEDGWNECLKLAQASGGQLYQASNGTVTYRQPYAIADAASTYTFTENIYGPGGVSERETTEQLATSVTCAYVSRELRPMQKIVEETTPRYIHVGEVVTISIEPQWPIYALDVDGSGNLKAECFIATMPWLATAVLGSHFTCTYVKAAQRIVLTITNVSGVPLTLWKYTLKGQPILTGTSGTITVGSGAVQRSISDNPYIQTFHDARRLANMVLKFYGVGRPVRSISGCVYDPNRFVGEVVGLTCDRFGITASPHIILSIKTDETGAVNSYDLAYVGDLGTTSDYFQVGPDYTGATKKITY